MKFPFLLSCWGSPVAAGQEGCAPGWALQGSAKPQEVSVVCQHPSLLQQFAFVYSGLLSLVLHLRKTSRNNHSPLFLFGLSEEQRDASFLLFILYFSFQQPDLGSACPCGVVVYVVLYRMWLCSLSSVWQSFWDGKCCLTLHQWVPASLWKSHNWTYLKPGMTLH